MFCKYPAINTALLTQPEPTEGFLHNWCDFCYSHIRTGSKSNLVTRAEHCKAELPPRFSQLNSPSEERVRPLYRNGSGQSGQLSVTAG